MTTGNTNTVFREAQGTWILWGPTALNMLAMGGNAILKHLILQPQPRNTQPPQILPCCYGPPSAPPQTQIILKQSVFLTNQGMHITAQAAFVKLVVVVVVGGGGGGGSHADRQDQKEEMCEAMECVLTADCTTQDSVRYFGRTWWSDSRNKHTGTHTYW